MTKSSRQVGTEGYVAPEGNRFDMKETTKMDIWFKLILLSLVYN